MQQKELQCLMEQNKGTNVQQKHMFRRHSPSGMRLSLANVHGMGKGNMAANCRMKSYVALRQIPLAAGHTPCTGRWQKVKPLFSSCGEFRKSCQRRHRGGDHSTRVGPQHDVLCLPKNENENENMKETKSKTTTTDKTMLNSGAPPTSNMVADRVMQGATLSLLPWGVMCGESIQ